MADNTDIIEGLTELVDAIRDGERLSDRFVVTRLCPMCKGNGYWSKWCFRKCSRCDGRGFLNA